MGAAAVSHRVETLVSPGLGGSSSSLSQGGDPRFSRSGWEQQQSLTGWRPSFLQVWVGAAAVSHRVETLVSPGLGGSSSSLSQGGDPRFSRSGWEQQQSLTGWRPSFLQVWVGAAAVSHRVETLVSPVCPVSFLHCKVTRSKKSNHHLCVCHCRDLQRVCSLREENRRRGKKFHIVTEQWVYDCIKDGKQLGERGYDPESH